MKIIESEAGWILLEKNIGDEAINNPIRRCTNLRLESAESRFFFKKRSLKKMKISMTNSSAKKVIHSFSNGSHRGNTILEIILLLGKWQCMNIPCQIVKF